MGLVALLAACGNYAVYGATNTTAVGVNPARGRELIQSYGCGACHSIPGVAGARGLVGPPLDNIGERRTIAGKLANTPDNMAHWVQAPQSVWSGNDMPDQGISSADARDIAAYLETLK